VIAIRHGAKIAPPLHTTQTGTQRVAVNPTTASKSYFNAKQVKGSKQ